MTTLLPFQKDGVRQMRRFKGRVLLGDETGLGKTLQSLTYIKERPQSFPAVVVCPAFLKSHWEHQAEIHVGMRAKVLEGRKPDFRKPLKHYPLLIINYDILPFWLDYLKRINPGIIVIDESHFIKSRNAKRTKAVKSLCSKVPRVLALGATPLTNRPSELFPVLNILRPDTFPSFFEFATRYCAPRRKPWGWEFKGATNLKELNRKLLDACMIRRRKKEVLKDLPEKTRDVIPIDLNQIKEYNLAEKNFITWLAQQKISKTKLRKAAKAEAIVKLGYLKRLAANLKLDSVIDWVDNFLQTSDEKIIIFAIHKKIIKRLKDQYGAACVVIDGSTSKARRTQRIQAFNHSKRCRILIGQLQATGFGWNGTVASNVLMVEFGWTPGENTQAEDRIHRIGQRKKSFIWYLVAKGTIEERLCKLIQQKQLTLDAVLDGKPMKEFNIFEKLMRSYERKAA